MSISSPVRCKCRKQAITGLRCSRCDTPICPDCSRPAPVGFFCRNCASNRKSPLYQVSAGKFFAAICIGTAAGAFGGWLLASLPFGAFFGLVAGFFYGTYMGEVVLRVTARKRGIKMELLAGGVAGIGVVLGRVIQLAAHGHLDPAMVIARTIADPMALLLIGVAVYGAVNRIRFM